MSKNVKTLNSHLKDISEITGYLSQRGWAEANAGNISFNITDLIRKKVVAKTAYVNKFKKQFTYLKNSYIWLTGAGVRMRDLAKDAENLSLIVNILDDGISYKIYKVSEFIKTKRPVKNDLYPEIKPTSELPTHLAIHNYLCEKKMTEKFILHTHPTELIALTQIKKLKSAEKINKILWGMHPETKIFLPEGIGFIPYTLPGTERIAELTIKAFENHRVILWEKHGCIAISENIIKAYDLIEIITKSAKIFFLCKSAKFRPEYLADYQIKELSDKYLHTIN
ncbi:MAG: rhamnulose-1-phosphate aldolase [Ignavibacteria bacterium]|nr:rhamnulose-1-phosphate aldolase [Ignavibacteria bacterium]